MACESNPTATPSNQIASINTPTVTIAVVIPTDTPATSTPTASPTETPTLISTETTTATPSPTATARPSSTPESANHSLLPPIPIPLSQEHQEDEENELQQWLLNARVNRVDIHLVSDAMVEAGWSKSGDVISLDFDQDDDQEWLIEFHRPQSECFRDAFSNCGGDFWIIGDDGLEYEFSPPDDNNFYNWGPIATTTRFTDEYPVITVIQTGGCGAHTCWDDFTIIGGFNGEVKHLVEYPTSRHEWGKTIMFWHSPNEYMPDAPPTIGMTYGNHAIIDVNGDGYNELLLAGGWAGSAGSGIQRTRTEIWGWTGTGIGLIELI